MTWTWPYPMMHVARIGRDVCPECAAEGGEPCEDEDGWRGVDALIKITNEEGADA